MSTAAADSPTSPFAAFNVIEVGGSLPGALCASHLGAMGMTVNAWRGTDPGTSPDDLGWDWSKSIHDGEPTPADVSVADVILFTPTGEEELLGARPDAVRVTFVGDFGRTVPSEPELLLQARSGLVGYVGKQEAAPIRIGAPVVTYASGVAGVQAVLASLYRRQRRGIGANVVISGLGVALALLGNNVTSESDPDERVGFAKQPWLPPRYGFQCADGVIDFVFHRNDGGFRQFCAWLGREELADDERFVSHSRRMDFEGELADELAPATAEHNAREVLEQLQSAGALCALRYPVDDLARNPQLDHLGLLRPLRQRSGQRRMVAQVPFMINGSRPQSFEVREVTR